MSGQQAAQQASQQTTDLIASLTNVDGKTVGDVMSRLYEQINVFVSQYGPEAWDGVLTLMQVKSIWDLAIGFLFLILAYLCLTKFQTYFRQEYDKTKKTYTNGEEQGDGFMIFGFIISIVVGVMSLGVSIFGYLFSFTLWLTAFSPQLGLAYRVLTKVVSF